MTNIRLNRKKLNYVHKMGIDKSDMYAKIVDPKSHYYRSFKNQKPDKNGYFLKPKNRLNVAAYAEIWAQNGCRKALHEYYIWGAWYNLSKNTQI